MAADEDKIKLLLELLGFEKVDDAVASLLHMRDAATGAQDAVEDTGKAAAKTAAAQAPLIESSEKAAGAATHAAAEYGHLVSELIASANTYKVADAAIDHHTRELIESIDATNRLTPALSRAEQEFEELLRTTLETTRAQRAMGQILDEVKGKQAGVGAAAKTTSITLGDFRQNLTGLGYVVNDFASVSGDMSQRLNAIANNLPMLLAGFGGLGLALSGIVPVLGIVIKNWDHIVAAFTGDTSIPKTTGNMDELKASLKAVNDELETLGKVRFDSLANAERYNRLATAQLDIERQVTAEKEKQAHWDKIKDLRPKDETEEAAAKAKALKDSVGGEQGRLAEIVQRTLGTGKLDAITREVADLQKQLERAPKHHEMESGFSPEQHWLEANIKEAEARQQLEQARLQSEARDVVAKAIGQGDAKAFGQMQQAVAGEADRAKAGGQADPNLERLRKKVDRATPEGRRQQAEVAEEVDKELDDQYKAAMKEQNDLIDTLNVVGENNQKRFEQTEKEQAEVEKNLAESRAEMERQQAKFKADMEKLQEQEGKAIDRFLRDRVDPGKQQQEQMAGQIQAATGADPVIANEEAKRSLELQRQGWDATSATQQAMMEVTATMAGQMQQVQMLQQRAAMISAQVKRLGARAGQADDMMPAMQFGWPN